MRTGFIWLRTELVAGSCEHGNELSVAIKMWWITKDLGASNVAVNWQDTSSTTYGRHQKCLAIVTSTRY